MKMITLHRKVDAKPIFVNPLSVVLVESRKNEMVNDAGCFVWIQSGGTEEGRLLREVMQAAKEVLDLVNAELQTIGATPLPPVDDGGLAKKQPVSAPPQKPKTLVQHVMGPVQAALKKGK